jgi:hypothetical protein
VSFLQQPLLSLDLSGLRLSLCSTAACVAFGRIYPPAACAAYGCVCSMTACTVPGCDWYRAACAAPLTCLPLLSLDMSFLQQFVPSLDVCLCVCCKAVCIVPGGVWPAAASASPGPTVSFLQQPALPLDMSLLQ